mmetsp:Transcript_1713/g.2465  ORF Transcript_1713/g.2465 Transcript_1713/m.2465 type:complete len:90 (+) Transcript_1713:331-600(+)
MITKDKNAFLAKVRFLKRNHLVKVSRTIPTTWMGVLFYEPGILYCPASLNSTIDPNKSMKMLGKYNKVVLEALCELLVEKFECGGDRNV